MRRYSQEVYDNKLAYAYVVHETYIIRNMLMLMLFTISEYASSGRVSCSVQLRGPAHGALASS